MPVQRHCWTRVHILAWAVFMLAAVWVIAPAPSGLSKDLELTGTVDCGVRSGHTCAIGDVVSIWTTDVDGTRRLVPVDITWIRSQLPGLDQDDQITFEVRD